MIVHALPSSPTTVLNRDFDVVEKDLVDVMAVHGVDGRDRDSGQAEIPKQPGQSRLALASSPSA